MKKKNSLKAILIPGMVWMLFLLTASGYAAERGYPNRDIEVVVHSSAGGMVDLAARVVCNELSKSLGVAVIVVNKPAGGGSVAAKYVAEAKPDGYTLLAAATNVLGTMHALESNLPYKISDFTPIAKVATSPYIFLARKESPWKTLEQLIDAAKKNPGKLTCSHAGVGSIGHFDLELLNL